MTGIQDFFGGSKRRSALQLLDQALVQFEVNPAYIDDGMRFAIYRWAQSSAVGTMSESGVIDELMRHAAALISYCVIGSEETEKLWGAQVRDERAARLESVLANGDEESFDAKLIKLVLTKGIAAPDIQAHVGLESVDAD